MNRGVSPSAVFKCSFGGDNGWGHVVRSSALADSFRRAGWRTELWTESDPRLLPSSVTACFARAGPDYSRDASVLVVDEMYTPDSSYEQLATAWRAGEASRFLVGIDDMQTRHMGAFDAVVNTELGLESASYRCELQLLGERYALVRSGFATPDALTHWPESRQRVPVLIMIGGTDAFSYTSRVLEELWRWRGDALAPAVVAGAASPSRDRDRLALERFSEGRFLKGLDASQLAAWMKRCAFAVVACGSSVYELAAMELPFVGLSLVDNQSATAAKIESLWGLPVQFRERRHEEPLDIQGELEAVSRLKAGTYSNVDTNGANRTRDAILASLKGG